MKRDRFGSYVNIAGYADGEDEKLYFDPGINRCGKILDGVRLAHGPRAGGWVVALEDLRGIVEAADKARAPKDKEGER